MIMAMLALFCSAHARRALIVIDMTVGQWESISYRRNSTLATVSKLMANKTVFFDLIIDSHLAMKCVAPIQGTICEIQWPRGSEATALLPVLQSPHVTHVAKESYSSFTSTTLDGTLRNARIDTLYVVGINTNYCVFATTLSAWELSYNVRVVEDGVTSCDGEAGHAQGLEMLNNFFVTYSSTERVQLVQSADIR